MMSNSLATAAMMVHGQKPQQQRVFLFVIYDYPQHSR